MEKRTPQQNRALHLYFKKLGDTLNDAGLDMKRTLKEGVDIPWTEESVKNHLWRPIQHIITGKDSTADISTKDIDKIFDVMNRHMGQQFGVHVEFPSEEELIHSQRGNNGSSNNK